MLFQKMVTYDELCFCLTTRGGKIILHIFSALAEEDVKTRPREHVRDDGGHSSGAITDKDIDVELRERHETARKKRIKAEFIE